MLDRIEKAMAAIGIDDASIVGTWKEIVELESYTRDPRAVEVLGTYLKSTFEAIGFNMEMHTYENAGPLLIGEMGEGDPSEGIILTGHMDTVFKTGTLAEIPFRVEDGRVYGPGVLDMKGGINLMIYISKLLKELGYTKPIKIVICGDEEHGHAYSDAAQKMQEACEGYKCAFNMETGLVDNSITVARKGRIEYEIKVHGKSAHAGANFADGINAIYELANIVVKINELNQKYEDVTFSVGIIHGGAISNAVPHLAEANVDIRYYNTEDGARIKNDIEAICSSPTIPGATAEASINSMFPPFMDTVNGSFYQLVDETSQMLGFGAVTPAHLGGSSDASYLTETGLPVLCSMGAKGEWNHTDREYAVIASAQERIKLITASILRLENKAL
ncbi:M20/M25/M40 family metallo-hydrolase [Fusibacter paucivorans]|uniref:M20/M25/M40 family metallo-hydrolase n=1 Tax=Fusibacter paucivorans TaxID=76009 RepID=A0ABS5PM00_9FIRM|nr:M20/M25/M40 family metallo-hydrolase [Fusibacter paucivorans]MBS7526168.1 M20/M25/M40 family metallo-hydrolase [Fusibacter paucivorans]